MPVTGTPATPKQPIDTAIGASTYLTHEYRPGLVFGVSVGAPFAYISEYPGTAVSRYTATKTVLQATNISPTIAWRSAAVSIYTTYNAELGTKVATSTTTPTVDTDINSQIEGQDLGFGFPLGLEYQMTKSTRIGASYRSAISHSFDGDVTLSGSAANYASLLALASANGVTITSPSGRARFRIKTPQCCK